MIELQQGSGFLSSCKHNEETGRGKRKMTGFFLYMKNIQAELELKAGTFLYMNEIVELAGPRWKQLSPEVREDYKAMAKSQRNPSLASPINE